MRTRKGSKRTVPRKVMIKLARQARQKSRSGIYHIMWRGANKQEIFHDEEDCKVILDSFLKYKAKLEVRVYAWCLMNNHVHLLVKEGNEPISDTMKRIGVSYVGYYNSKYNTTGHLFQDRFRSEVVETARSFKSVIRYIHQNPLKAGLIKHVKEWKWSSCLGYYDEDVYPHYLLDRDSVLNLFCEDKIKALEMFIEFNEKANEDVYLDEHVKRRLTDDEAREMIKEVLGKIEIAQVKSLPRHQRNEILRRIKEVRGISQRQASRIVGVSPNLVAKA